MYKSTQNSSKSSKKTNMIFFRSSNPSTNVPHPCPSNLVGRTVPTSRTTSPTRTPPRLQSRSSYVWPSKRQRRSRGRGAWGVGSRVTLFGGSLIQFRHGFFWGSGVENTSLVVLVIVGFWNCHVIIGILIHWPVESKVTRFLENLSMSSPADTQVIPVETKAKGGMVYIVHVFFLDGIRTSRSDSLFFTEHLKWRLGFQTYCLFLFSTWLCFSIDKISSIAGSPMMSLFSATSVEMVKAMVALGPKTPFTKENHGIS